MKTKFQLRPVASNTARPNRPHFELLPQAPGVKSERQRQEEDELRLLIKSLQRRDSDDRAGRTGNRVFRKFSTDDDFPSAA